MSKYATQTQVSPEKSQAEVQQLLRRYGATKQGVFEEPGWAHVVFEFNRLSIRISVSLPAGSDPKFRYDARKRLRNEAGRHAAWQQESRTRWRCLLLAIKAKLEAVETGISTIEREFLPFVVMPDGRTLYDHIQPKLVEHAATGQMPQLLALPAGNSEGGNGR